MSFEERLKSLMKEKRITQNKLAEKSAYLKHLFITIVVEKIHLAWRS